MTTFSRRPCPALAPWVQCLWATRSDPAQPSQPYRERVLPTGAMHIVLRLDAPLTLFDDPVGTCSHTLGPLIVGGARAANYVKQAGDNACSVGVQLQPGAASALLGAPAGELAERHTSLDALWGLDAVRLHERLATAGQHCRGASQAASDLGLSAQVDVFEKVLLARLQRAAASERQVGWMADAVSGLESGAPLSTLVASSGVSHRTFITRFRDGVGLSPKVFARIRRFQRVIGLMHGASNHSDASNYNGALNHSDASKRTAPSEQRHVRFSLAQLALDAGYADQAHFSRDFLEFAGVTPTAYVRLAPTAANHVRVR